MKTRTPRGGVCREDRAGNVGNVGNVSNVCNVNGAGREEGVG